MFKQRMADPTLQWRFSHLTEIKTT